jgi:hypothetical protein
VISDRVVRMPSSNVIENSMPLNARLLRYIAIRAVWIAETDWGD